MVATGPMWLLKIQIPVPQPHCKDGLVRAMVGQVSHGELFLSKQFVWVVLLSHPVTSETTNVCPSLFTFHMGGADTQRVEHFPSMHAAPASHRPGVVEDSCHPAVQRWRKEN